jgi:twinkle protein
VNSTVKESQGGDRKVAPFFKGKKMVEVLDEHEGSKKIGHVPCKACGSKDNAAVFTDGHTYCFGCQDYQPPQDQVEQQPTTAIKRPTALIDGYYTTLSVRKITEETCRKFDYQVTDSYNNRPQQIANYRNSDGLVVAQKIRDADKNFSILGDAKKMTLFGQHLWNGGRKIVITEGEIDCMSVCQVQGNKWPTVSLGQGATSGKKALIAAWDFLQQFEEIILMFDQDEVGQRAAVECAEALPVGKVKIAKLPYKDANECLQQGEGKAIINAIWQAKDWRPDGIVSSDDFRDIIGKSDSASTVDYPYKKLNDMTRGIRTGLVTICAGSGVGKSTFIREIAYSLHNNGQTVGMLMLEETNKRTLQGLVGLHMEKNITIDDGVADEPEIIEAYDSLLGKRPIYLFDHFGSTAVDTIVNRIQYMVKGMGCKHIFLDHVSILVSGLTGQVTDERRLIDQIMTLLRKLVQELDICLFLVSHLRRPEGTKGHENGAKVQLSQLRGSHALAQLADFCIGLQVNEEDPSDDQREVVLLKNRFTGEVGQADTLQYNRITGRLIEADSRF